MIFGVNGSHFITCLVFCDGVRGGNFISLFGDIYSFDIKGRQ